MKAKAKPDGTEISISTVSRQMSRNLAGPAVALVAFQTVADFVAAYSTTDKMIADLTGKFLGVADLAKQKQDEIIPHLAYMQSLLSKKGKNHGLVMKARKKGHKIPWWTTYYNKYKDQLWESLRTMERRIALFRKDPSVETSKPEKSTKPKHLTQLEHKLLGTATCVREVIVDLRAGRTEEAIAKLDKNTPTLDRIDEQLKRGVKPSHDNPDGDARVQGNNLEQRPDGRDATLSSPALSAGAPMSQSATYQDWERHQLTATAPVYKRKYFAQASSDFTDRFAYSTSGSAFKKLLLMLREKPEQVLANAQDFQQLAVVLRGAADNLNLLAAVITTTLTPIPASKLELGDQEGSKKRPKGSASSDAGTDVRSHGVGL
jgi:hypothetical protein